MSDLLAHPLFLLLTGALVSGLLIPAWTRHWQDHQKGLEIKTELVSEISELVMTFVMAVQSHHINSRHLRRQLQAAEETTQRDNITEELNSLGRELNSAYRRWEVKSAVMGTRLQAYFLDTDLPHNWTQFSDVVTRFYALEGAREDQPRRISDMVAELEQIAPGPPRDAEPLQPAGWGYLRAKILQAKSELIRAVMTSKTSAIGAPGLLDRLIGKLT